MFEKIILAPGITLYKTDINKVNSILNQIEPALSDMWHPAQVVNTDSYENEVALARKCYSAGVHRDILSSTNDQLKRLYIDTEEWFSEPLNDYIQDYSIEKTTLGPYVYLKYGQTDKFDWHIDDGRRYPRTISISAYLNSDFEGGEIEFKHFNVSHKPSAGDIVIFSGAFPYMHRVKPVTNGTRYTVVNWYRYSTYPEEME